VRGIGSARAIWMFIEARRERRLSDIARSDRHSYGRVADATDLL
jgi:hypothetical protein